MQGTEIPEFPTRKPLDMESFAAESSNVHSGLYDYGVSDLYLRFKRDGVDAIYFYSGVPARTWSQLVNAPSKGRYINENVAYAFRYERISLSDWPQQGRHVDHPIAKRFLTAPITADKSAAHPYIE